MHYPTHKNFSSACKSLNSIRILFFICVFFLCEGQGHTQNLDEKAFHETQTQTRYADLKKNNSDTADSKTFAGYFTEAAAQNNVTIVAEDVPLRLKISTDEKNSLVAALKNLPIKQQIQGQAAFFDYDCVFLGPSLAVLRKKYTNSNDLPYVSFEEAANLLDTSNRLISRFKSPFKYGNFDNDANFLAAVSSLSNEQIASMKQAKLSIQSLTPTQKQQAWNALVSFYIDKDALASIQSSQFDLDTVRLQKEGYFHRFLSSAEYKLPSPFASFAFVYPATRNPYAKTDTLPLCYQKQQRKTALGEEVIFSKRDEDGNTVAFHDASEPDETDRNRAKEQLVAHQSSTTTTFKKLAQHLTERTSGKVLYVVDEALAENPVSIFGAEKTEPEAVFAACAAVYDLRIVKERQNGIPAFVLKAPTAIRPSTLRDLPSAIRRILPGPYVRALHLPDIDYAFAEADAAKDRALQEKSEGGKRRNQGEKPEKPILTDAEQKQRTKERAKNKLAWERWSNSPDTLELAALRRFRATVEQKAALQPNKNFPISALDTEERTTLTTALMRIALDGLQNFCLSKQPDYIERFDQLILSGGPYLDKEDQKTYIELQFGFTKTNGSFDAKAGIAHIPYVGKWKAE